MATRKKAQKDTEEQAEKVNHKGSLWRMYKFPEKRGKGQPPLFDKPEDMWNKAQEYFEFMEDNPIEIDENVGSRNINKVKKKRPFSIKGFCIFSSMTTQTFYNYKKREDFFDITRVIEEICQTQQLEGANIGIFQQNIVARQLGLSDKVDQTVDQTVTEKKVVQLGSGIDPAKSGGPGNADDKKKSA